MASDKPYKPALIIVDFQEDFCPPVSIFSVAGEHGGMSWEWLQAKLCGYSAGMLRHEDDKISACVVYSLNTCGVEGHTP